MRVTGPHCLGSSYCQGTAAQRDLSLCVSMDDEAVFHVCAATSITNRKSQIGGKGEGHAKNFDCQTILRAGDRRDGGGEAE